MLALDSANAFNESVNRNAYRGIECALSQIDYYSMNYNRHQVIILLVAGMDSSKDLGSKYDKCIEEAISKKVSIYTIGIGEVDKALLMRISRETGAKSYFTKGADNIEFIFRQIEEHATEYVRDANGDYINDYYSKLLCEGKIKIGTQKNLFDGITYEAFNSNNDYDGDGIENGRELSVRYNKITKKVYLYLNSNPFEKDSDGDGIDDLYDSTPLFPDGGFVIYETADTDTFLKNCSFEERPEDYQYADKSLEQLKSMRYINWADFFMTDENYYIYMWKSLVKTGSSGDMQDVAIDMVNHLLDGSGTDYENTTLTKTMEEHENSKSYMESVEKYLNEYIKNNKGDISGLLYEAENREDSVVRNYMDYIDLMNPKYNDIFSGLGMCIHGLYGLRIEITSYKFNGKSYEYTVQYTLYDVYGLDSKDIEENEKFGIHYGAFDGFKTWYILQHWDEYNGEHKPFITYAKFIRTVKGRI